MFFVTLSEGYRVIGWLRVLVLVAFSGLQFFLVLTARLELFPAVSMIGMLPLIPTFLVHRAGSFSGESPLQKVFTRIRGFMGRFLSRFDKTVKINPSGMVPVWMGLICLVIFSYSTWTNLTHLGALRNFEKSNFVTEYFFLEQDWEIFSEFDRLRGFHEIAAETEDGHTIYFYQGGPIENKEYRWNLKEPDRPISRSLFKTMRWRMYFRNFRTEDHPIGGYYAEYVCRRWNKQKGVNVETLDVLFVFRPLRFSSNNQQFSVLEGDGSEKVASLIRYDCRTKEVSFPIFQKAKLRWLKALSLIRNERLIEFS